MVSHQVGGFLGAWLGGKAFEATGNYDWMWYADIVLALGAALVHLSFDRLRTALRQAQDGRQIPFGLSLPFDRLRTALRQAQDGRRVPFGLSLSFDRLRTVGRSRSG